MERKVAHLYLHTHPQGLSGCFCGDPQDPPKPDRCQPIDCENWLDVAAGMELIWPDGKVVTVHSVELWAAYPGVVGKPVIVSGRDWERTGLDAAGNPTQLLTPEMNMSRGGQISTGPKPTEDTAPLAQPRRRRMG